MARKKAESSHEIEYLVKGDEKLLGAVCHLSIFFLPIILPLIIWLLERQKKDFSPYVVFQAKQALIYQILVFITFLSVGLFGLVISIFLVGFLFVPAFIILYLMALLYAAYGGIKCLMGEDFHYYFIGEKIHELRI